jgi:hypothetical protein
MGLKILFQADFSEKEYFPALIVFIPDEADSY